MSANSPGQRKFIIRREMRLRRDKAAALIMAALMAKPSLSLTDGYAIPAMARAAVSAADELLGRLDATWTEPAEPPPVDEPIPFGGA